MAPFTPLLHDAIRPHQSKVLRDPWTWKLEAINERVDIFFAATERSG